MALKYTVIRPDPNYPLGLVVGHIRQYADGRYSFSPSVQMRKKTTGTRHTKIQDAIPAWAGTWDNVRLEAYE